MSTVVAGVAWWHCSADLVWARRRLSDGLHLSSIDTSVERSQGNLVQLGRSCVKDGSNLLCRGVPCGAGAKLRQRWAEPVVQGVPSSSDSLPMSLGALVYTHYYCSSSLLRRQYEALT